MRAPADPAAIGRAQQQLAACPEPPVRACELGAALDARPPLDAGTTPLRELLEFLCQRCPAGTNPCAGFVTRAVMGIVGVQGGEKAFDGQETTGVDLTATPRAPRWEKDGALSAVFDPLSVFPDKGGLTLSEVEARGTR